MRIIREADGGLYTHKKKYTLCIEDINGLGDHGERGIWFDELCENNTISVSSFMAGCRRGGCYSDEEIREMASDMRAEGLH